jgi:hypothetical protein
VMTQRTVIRSAERNIIRGGSTARSRSLECISPSRRSHGNGRHCSISCPENSTKKEWAQTLFAVAGCGAAFALAFMDYLIRSEPTNGNATLLGCIMGSIAEKSDDSGIACGFMLMIGRILGALLSKHPDVVTYARKAVASEMRAYRKRLREIAKG